jgi:hypothetical protein
LLQSALDQLRLEGAIFFRSELTEGFAFESTPLALADVLHPGAERLILFHIVARGSCWVSVADGERHKASQGDVIVLPYGDHHTIGGDTPALSVPILTLLDDPPWTVMPTIRHGGGGTPTDLVCGYLYSEDPLFDPALKAFPPVFVVRLPAGAATSWVQASIAYSLEEAAPSNASPSLISTRLPELVLIEVLRVHLATAPAADHGWMAARRDPVRAPALSLLHHRFATSRSGACTWRKSSSPPPISVSSPWPDASATTRKRHSAEHSNGPGACRRATGAPPVLPLR